MTLVGYRSPRQYKPFVTRSPRFTSVGLTGVLVGATDDEVVGNTLRIRKLP
jgi:hypothetical protein